MRRFTAFDASRMVLLLLAIVAVALPLLWVVLASFKTPADLNQPGLIWFTPTMANWTEVLGSDLFAAVGRSVLVATITVAIAVVVGSMGAYSIARFQTGGSLSRFGILASQVLPPAVLVFPFLSVAYMLRLNGTLVPVIFSHLSFVVPVVTWFLIGFFAAVPKEIEEQARVDGFNRFDTFRLVVLPQVLPGIGAAAIFGFTLSWNDMFYGLILSPANSTILPVAIAGFNTFRGVELGPMSAAIVIAIVPVVIASFFVQKRLVQGISGGAVKG